MSTPSFGQPPAFGAPAPAAAPLPIEEPAAGSSKKTVVIAAAAGVVALGVLGGAAFLVLGAGSDATVDGALPPAPIASVEPSAAPSEAEAPLPTAAVQGRNVFVPLVEDKAAAGEGGEAVDPVAAAAPTPTPSAAATSAPVTVPTSAPLPVSLPVSFPVPAVTRTVPGPVTTEQVPGPTVTATEPGPVQTLDRFAYAVEVVSVTDPDPDPAVTGDSTAVFKINGNDVPVLEGGEFLEVFKYYSYEPGTPAGTDPVTPEVLPVVTFAYGSSLWSVPTGTRYGLGPR